MMYEQLIWYVNNFFFFSNPIVHQSERERERDASISSSINYHSEFLLFHRLNHKTSYEMKQKQE